MNNNINDGIILMIPKKIHYCWFGGAEMPEKVKACIVTWHNHMPDWEYCLWNETNFDIAKAPVYVREAYEANIYAFVSDWVRLWALEKEGGLYMDVDFMVHKSFDDLMDKYDAFAGIEGSKHRPVMMGIIATKAHGEWVQEMMGYYVDRHFCVDGGYDLTPNVTFLTGKMLENGFQPSGQEQDYKDLHIFPTDYFSPRQTSGEYLRTENTYCETVGLNSWAKSNSWRNLVIHLFPEQWKPFFIKIKRKLFG